MIPIVANGHGTDAITNAKTGYGLGALSDCISCHVIEERNGAYYLELEYPSGGNAWEHLVPGNFIRCVPSDGADETLFQVDSVKPSISGRIAVQALHLSYRNRFAFVEPFGVSSLSNAISWINTARTSGAGAAIHLNVYNSGDFPRTGFRVRRPMAVRDVMMGTSGSLIDVYGGEWLYESCGAVARLALSRGKTRKQGVRYGKNMVSLELEKALAETYDGVFGYYYDEQSGTYVGATTVQYGTRRYDVTADRYKVVDFTSEFDSVPTSAQLDAKALSYARANALGEPQVSIKVGIAPLHQTIEYAGIYEIEHIQLCDTLPIVYERYGIELSAKVVKTDYDVLTERYRSVEIGTRKVTLPDFLKGVSAKTGVSVWT